MSIDRALDNIFEGKLDEMRSNFAAALSTKAVEKLEERKIEIAQNYFGLNENDMSKFDDDDEKTRPSKKPMLWQLKNGKIISSMSKPKAGAKLVKKD